MQHHLANKERFYWIFAGSQTHGARRTDGEVASVDMVDSNDYEKTMSKHRSPG